MPRREPIPKRKHYEVPEATKVVLEWRRFRSLERACAAIPNESCLYVLQKHIRSLYVGKAGSLRRRYSPAGGLLEAALCESDALLFVAPLAPPFLEVLEHQIIFWDCPPFNVQGRGSRPSPHVSFLCRFDGVSSVGGSGYAVEPGATYEGPHFCGPGTLRDAYSGIPT